MLSLLHHLFLLPNRELHLCFACHRRLLLEDRLMDEIQQIRPSIDGGQTREMIRRWFREDVGDHNNHLFEDNQKMCQWYQSQLDGSPTSLVQENLHALRKDAVSVQFNS